ncbi:MLP-like protein 329 [Pyrus ussuriensis x Pyrus communis]|uniref:MLP-like protein 329 n=1 Tax=Pyrus ussuriensis x Pyrus communis TaxID=2448454 RepID=A0A5N5HFD8_9ROSA|nr:MLP-like protein 329 [Pyrus ussuriensis x Pyrus communis]
MAVSGAGACKLTVQAEVEIKANADKLYKVISNQHHDVPKAASDKIHDVAVHEGDWETSGSVKLWKYTLDGNVETFKEKVEIDEANKWVSLTALEGSHVLDNYKSYKIIFQATPKSEGGSVKITLEYEKLNENDPPPQKYLSFMVNVIKDIDAHLLKE